MLALTAGPAGVQGGKRMGGKRMERGEIRRPCQTGMRLCDTRRCEILGGSILGCVRQCMRPRLHASQRASL